MTKIKKNIKKEQSKSKVSVKKVFFISLIILLILVALFFSVRYFLFIRERTLCPYEFIPENPLSIVEINNVQDFLNAIRGGSIFSDFKNILSYDDLYNDFDYFDSLFSVNAKIQNAWLEGSMLIVFHYGGSENYQTLFIKPLPHPNYSSSVEQFFKKHSSETKILALPGIKEKIMQYTFNNKTVYSYINGGVCLFSTSSSSVQKSLKMSRLSEQNHIGLNDLRASSGKTCIANIYINYSFFNRFFFRYTTVEMMQFMDAFNSFAVWGSYDIHLKKDKVYFTGFASTEGMTNSYLEIFSSFQPQKTDIISILPRNTLAFAWFGFNSYETFREQYKEYLKKNKNLTEFNSNLSNLKRRTGVDNINELIFPYIDNQFALVSTSARGEKNSENYAVFKIKSPKEFQSNIEHIMQITAGTTGSSHVDTSSFRNYAVLSINSDFMLFDLFGKLFNSIEKTYLTIFDNYCIVGNSKEAIKQYLNQVLSGRTLNNNPLYTEFSQFILAEANIYLYATPRNTKNLIQMCLNDKYVEDFHKYKSELNNFEGLGIQFYTYQEKFLSSILLFRSADTLEEVTTEWEINVGAQVASGPWFVDVAQQATKNIILFDAFNNMYYISDQGEILWKIPIAEKPLSKVFSVDMYKNGKYQYLFNTENYIYMIDRNGKSVEKFPFKLPVQGAGSINLFDYDNNKDYRIVYSGIDNIIYNYTIKPEPTTGWMKPDIKLPAAETVNHKRIINSDVLFVKDNQNRRHFFNRRGVPLFEHKDINFSQYSDLYPAPKLCRCFVTTTTDGRVVMIGLNGETEYKTVHQAGEGHVFIYFDIDNDGNGDFIFIEKGKAYVFDNKGNVISGFDITDDAGRKSGTIKDSPYGPLLYVFSSDGSEFYLLNKTERILKERKFHSSNHADFYASPTHNKLFVTSSKANALYMYIIE